MAISKEDPTTNKTSSKIKYPKILNIDQKVNSELDKENSKVTQVMELTISKKKVMQELRNSNFPPMKLSLKVSLQVTVHTERPIKVQERFRKTLSSVPRTTWESIARTVSRVKQATL